MTLIPLVPGQDPMAGAQTPAPSGAPPPSGPDTPFVHPPGAMLTIVRTLASAIADLAAERYKRECAGVMFQPASASAPVLIGTDRDSQGKLNAAFVMAGAGHWTDGIPWKAADGSFVSCTAAEVMALAVKAAVYVGGCYAHEAALTAALAADLDTDITAGWPSNA